MTKKHFEAIAENIRERREAAEVLEPHARFAARQALAAIARDLASIFMNANPRFDRDKFLTACGL